MVRDDGIQLGPRRVSRPLFACKAFVDHAPDGFRSSPQLRWL